MMIQGQAAGHPGRQSRPQVAVIGAGVAGLTAAYLLQRAYDVTLYEAQDRLGGHAHTHDIAAARGGLLALDSGFLVHNTRTYPHHFTSHFVIPLVAAVWSCPPAEALAYPARYLCEFLDHHGMLRVGRSRGWRTVTGGSRCYVERIAKQLTAVAAGARVRAVRRVTGGVDICDDSGGAGHFARAVIATHPDEALQLVDAPTAARWG
jgi:predicted NAD/FAD-binding protein